MTLDSGKRDRAKLTYTYKCKKMQSNLIRRRVKEFRMFTETKNNQNVGSTKTAVRRGNVNIIAEKFTINASIRYIRRSFLVKLIKVVINFFYSYCKN